MLITKGAGLTTAALAMALCSAVATSAQEQEPEKKDEYSVSQLGLNFDVPESPAFTVLDLNPQNVTRSATPRDFAASLINGLDRNGNFQSGLAVELTPWGIANRNFFVGNNEIPVSNNEGTGYADGDFTLWNCEKPGRFMRNFWYRTALSFATTKGAQSEDDALRLAAGLRMVPWDAGDSRLIVGRCLIEKVESLRGVVDLLSDADIKAGTTPSDPASLASLEQALNGAGTLPNATGALAAADAATAKFSLSTPAPGNAEGEPDLAQQARTIVNAIGSELRVLNSRSAVVDIREEIDAAQKGLFESGAQDRVTTVASRLNFFTRTMDDYFDARASKESVEPAATHDGAPSELERRARAATSVLDDYEKKESAKEAADNPSDVDQAAVKKVADRIAKDCQAGEEGRWNGSSWDIAVAPSWISDDGNTSSFKWNGGGVWSSLSIGDDIVNLFNGKKQVGGDLNKGDDHRFQAVLHGRYRFAERVKDETTMMGSDGSETMVEKNVDQDTWLVGARFRILLQETRALFLQPGVGVSFEGSISNTDVSGKAAKLKDDTYYRFAAVPTLRIAENVWIDVAFGTETGRKTGNEAFVLSSIKYGYGQEPFPSLRSGSGN